MRGSNVRLTVFPLICSVAIFAFLVVLASTTFAAAQQRQVAAATSLDVMPRYDTNRNLVLPDDYRRWVLVGSSLGLSYSEVGQGGHQMFNTTLMEPSAYQITRDKRRSGYRCTHRVPQIRTSPQPTRDPRRSLRMDIGLLGR